MQLILQSEPASTDIKKTMSTLGEAVEDNQVNGVVAVITNDVCNKISNSKNDKVPKPLEDGNEEYDGKDCNGVTLTNGDSQIEDKVAELDKIETEIIDNSENGSSANGECNGNLTNDSCKDPISAPASISEIDQNVDLDKKLVSESVKHIEENIVTCDMNSTDVIDNKNSSDNVDKQASVCNEKVPVDISGQMLENDELLLEDTAEDKSSNETENNILNNVTESNVPESQEIQSSITESTEKNDDVTISEQVKSNTVDTRIEDSSIVSIEETPIETNVKEVDNLQKETSSIKETIADNLSFDVTENPDSNDKTDEKTESSTDSIEKLSEENTKKISCSKMDMNLDKNKPEAEDKSDKEESVVEPSLATQKYITVKNITEMTVNDEITKKNYVSNDLDEQESEIHEIDHSESMDVDDADVSIVLPENGNLNITDRISIVENDVETTDTTKTKKIEVISQKENEIEISVKVCDGVVMEFDDTDEVTFVDKCSIADKNIESNTAVVHNSENDLKQDSVINIIDNDDDEKDNVSANNDIRKDDTSEVISIEDNVKDEPEQSEISSETEEKIMKVVETKSEEKDVEKNSKTPEKVVTKQLPVVCKLSNTMDILSDEEDEAEKPIETNKTVSDELKASEDQNKCINIDDDDDIMFIEETNSSNLKNEDIKSEQESTKEETQTNENSDNKTDFNESEVMKISPTEKIEDVSLKISEEDDKILNEVKPEETKPINPINEIKPIITQDFLKSVTKNLADMTRNELEDFCILKLVESVVDKSNLNEIKNKMKMMAQTVEDLRKKAVGLAKQNRDLQVVVKTVQEDQKKRNISPMMPMKITRSVGMQVVLTPAEKVAPKKNKNANPSVATSKAARNNLTKIQKPPVSIPVPRLVPASSPTVKSPVTANATKTTNKTTPQRPEKRPHSKLSPSPSLTVDLTDDEPPAKVNTKAIPPVRLVPSQNLMATKSRPQLYQTSPRKVYIPISSTNQNMRPGTGVIRNFIPSPRARAPSVVRMQAVRLQAPTSNRHPAPLPDAMKQYQPPAWKALPPAPDLKLTKVDNGIVISWKFDENLQDSYEDIASFQLYAYQETPAPPSTALWKKIGDIKALPLPMACTLTQFMSGFKYYFAVRAIDVRSRIGPFSMPGNIMLINKP